MKRRERGQALVEFALIIPVFALILFTLLDFGRVIYTQNTVEQAAREASRVATLEAVEASWKYGLIRNAAISSAAGLGLTATNINGQGCANCFYPNGAISGEVVVVTVSTTVALVTPIVSQVLGGSFTVTSPRRGSSRERQRRRARPGGSAVRAAARRHASAAPDCSLMAAWPGRIAVRRSPRPTWRRSPRPRPSPRAASSATRPGGCGDRPRPTGRRLQRLRQRRRRVSGDERQPHRLQVRTRHRLAHDGARRSAA